MSPNVCGCLLVCVCVWDWQLVRLRDRMTDDYRPLPGQVSLPERIIRLKRRGCHSFDFPSRPHTMSQTLCVPGRLVIYWYFFCSPTMIPSRWNIRGVGTKKPSTAEKLNMATWHFFLFRVPLKCNENTVAEDQFDILGEFLQGELPWELPHT